MDISIFVETTFDNGEIKRRNIGRLRRVTDEFDSENFGASPRRRKILVEGLAGSDCARSGR